MGFPIAFFYCDKIVRLKFKKRVGDAKPMYYNSDNY